MVTPELALKAEQVKQRTEGTETTAGKGDTRLSVEMKAKGGPSGPCGRVSVLIL